LFLKSLVSDTVRKSMGREEYSNGNNYSIQN